MSDRPPAAPLRLHYPPELPVTERRADLLAAIRAHQVVIVAGETGSGKTTQLPKMCLELGRGAPDGQGRPRLIGHTQPRRIAARAVADRIAEELGVELGSTVGYQVRFTDRISDQTRVKVMTDGILLAEIRRDRDLRRYDTLIIDEAHERSLTIDFLLGYLTRLLPRRPDLKVIITSATIDTEKFATHFGGAPIIEVSGRTYPVEVRYRDPADTPDADDVQRICMAVDELLTEGPGDVLVFVSGEREIRDATEALTRSVPIGTEILPLYARLTAAEQHRVFAEHAGRRVVVSTNVAETSLTVPGIRYVVDTGVARISRYSTRLKVQRLPIEPISQASANQRSGRCGRLGPGVCIRLYSETDFAARPAFTEPEILRTNLASVLLQMASLRIGSVADFPFVDPPDPRSISAGISVLEEIGAFAHGERDESRRLTDLGRRLSRVPLDPRFARMVMEAAEQGCLHDVLVITAALTIQDPRERPPEHQQAADRQHARFTDPHSDFTAYLNLWRYIREQQKELSSSAFRRLCRDEFLHYLRIREWQDLVAQLRQVANELGMRVSTTPASPDAIHQSLLTGLLSHVGLRDQQRRDYLGARGARFAIWPGSGLAKAQPTWVVAAELVETSRLWGRVVARTDPLVVERLAGHLVTRTYSEPHWSKRSAAVMASERVTLYGVPLVTARAITYSRIDPQLCRDLFIRHALVLGEWQTHHQVVRRNRELLEDVSELEHRARRRDLIVDEEDLVEFYDARLPVEIVSGRHFDSWWKKARHETPDLLTLTEADLIREGIDVSASEFPVRWSSGPVTVDLDYRFAPGDADDGITARIPISILHQVQEQQFGHLVPGRRLELVIALLRTLPKPVRTRLIPAPDVAASVLPQLDLGQPMTHGLALALREVTGVEVDPRDFRPEDLPAHLRMTFAVEDVDGHVIATGKDLAALQQQLADRTRAELSAIGPDLEREQVTDWPESGVPHVIERQASGITTLGYPALVDEGPRGVSLRILPSPQAQQAAMARGLRRLLRLNSPVAAATITRSLSNAEKLTLARNPHGSIGAMVDDTADALIDTELDEALGAGERGVRTRAEYEQLLTRIRTVLPARLPMTLVEVESVLGVWGSATAAVSALTAAHVQPAAADMRAQMGGLVHPGFIAEHGLTRLADLRRYLRAIEHRAMRVPADAPRDLIRMEQVERVMAARDAWIDRESPTHDARDRVRWMIEELRVSLFAQDLGAKGPISEQRILKAMSSTALRP